MNMTTLHIHHHYYGHTEGEGFFKHIGSEIKQGGTQFGKQVATTLVDKGIPGVASALGSVVGDTLGGPLGGVAGATLGQSLGQRASSSVQKQTGYGLGKHRKPKLAKGSAEAKAWGEKMRAARMKGGEIAPPSRIYETDPSII